MRIGFFGGTFDPPHRGHLAVAKAARLTFRLDRILLAPTGRQPLKSQQRTAPFADRLAMTKLLCRGEAGLHATDIDRPLDGGGANYTIDTLRRLRDTLPKRGRLFAIVGADAFLDLPRWRDPQGLLSTAEWIVVSRPETSLDARAAPGEVGGQSARIHFLRDLAVPVSSTAVRTRLRRGDAATELLTPAIARYIAAQQLYGP